MKRLLLVSPFPPYIGGVSISVQRLYDNLLLQGFEVEKFDIQYRNQSYNRYRLLKLARFLSLPFFIAGRKHFDVIHFHVSGILPKLYVRLWRRFFPGTTKFIVTLHGQASHIVNSMLGRYSLGCFDRIICVKSGDILNMPLELKDRSVEIPAFIPPSAASGSDVIPVCLRNYLENNVFRIVINGSIIPDGNSGDIYGFMSAVHLMEELRNSGRKAILIAIVLGKEMNRNATDYLKMMKDYCHNKGIGKSICWIVGADMELWPVLSRVNVLLRPTKSDGDALSVREALYLKIPVIASDVVPRPADAITYDVNSEKDLFSKTISLMDSYGEYVAGIGDNKISFAQKIIEQYEVK